MRQTLKRAGMLRRRQDIGRVRDTGRRVSGQVLYLRYAPAPATDERSSSVVPGQSDRKPTRRVAFLLGRGIGSAVRRNRLKRRLRELYRRNRDWFPDGFDYLLRVAPDAADLSYRHLARHIQALSRKLRDDRQGD